MNIPNGSLGELPANVLTEKQSTQPLSSKKFFEKLIPNRLKRTQIVIFGTLTLLVALTVLIIGLLSYNNYKLRLYASIVDFDSCSAAKGSIIQESYPEVCVAKDGRRFARVLTNEEQKNLKPPNETVNWATYLNEIYGFTFKYDPEINFQAEDLAMLNKVDEGGINITKYFIDLNNSQPPNVLFGLSPKYEPVADTDDGRGYVYPNYFSVWVMENNTKIDPDSWYDKFAYFPLGLSKKSFDQYAKSSQTIDNIEGRYIEYNDVVKQKLILINKDKYMYLIHIISSSDMDNQILSTFKFIDHATPTSTISTSSWKTYNDSQLGYEIKYPANYYIKIDDLAVTISGSVNSESDEFALGITIQPLSKTTFTPSDNTQVLEVLNKIGYNQISQKFNNTTNYNFQGDPPWGYYQILFASENTAQDKILVTTRIHRQDDMPTNEGGTNGQIALLASQILSTFKFVDNTPAVTTNP